MKLNQNTSPVEISGAISSPSTFSIAASKEAFKILSSGLYTNKIRAIIRELSCNAWDAHVAAGKSDIPFAVHLPTGFEPFFSVKDQGTGLEYRPAGCSTCKGKGKVITDEREEDCQSCKGTGDYDAVLELYCRYFSSDKSDSNLFVGALGLGSKSPFSYTEGFSVTNVYGGMKRVYSCFIDEKGMPSVLLQTQEESTEPNGVEIQFPVKQNDTYEFENQAEYVWEFFDPKPETNNSRLRIKEEQYTLKTEFWGLRRDSRIGGVRAIQGMVQYGIGNIDESRLTSNQRTLLKKNLDLFFPIGELEVAASRESLSNSEQTIINILKAIDGVEIGLLDEAKKQIAECETPWAARVLIFSLSNNSDIGPILSRAHKEGKLNDVNPKFNLKDTKTEIDAFDYPNVAIFEYEYNSRNKVQARKDRLTPAKALSPSVTEYKVCFEPDKKEGNQEVVVLNDVGFGVEKYVNYLIQTNEESDVTIKRAYFITTPCREVGVDKVIEEGTKIIEVLGNPPVILMSELKERYKDVFSQAQYKPKPPRKLLAFDENSYAKPGEKGWRNGWDEISSEDLPAGLKYYVPLKNLEPQTGSYWDFKEFKAIVQSVKLSGVLGLTETTQVYGIPFWNMKDLDNTWVEFSAYVMQRFKEYITPERELKMSLEAKPFNCSIDTEIRELAKSKVLLEDSPFLIFAKRYAEAYRSRNVASLLQPVIAKAEKLKIHKITNTISFEELYTEVKKKYPLLGFLGKNWREENFTAEIEKYVKMIDDQHKQTEQPEPVTFAIAPLLESQEERIYVNVN